jgi:DNA/RNA endonuclease G (NUC1)
MLQAMLKVHAYKVIATGVMEKHSMVGSSSMQIPSQIYKVIVTRGNG